MRSSPVFAARLKRNGPLPSPLPVVRESQFASLRAVHAQPLAADIDTAPAPAAAGMCWLRGDTSKRHGLPAWTTRTRVSLMTMSASRDAASGFAAALKLSSELPWPETGESAEIQSAPGEAVHVHSGAVVTTTRPAPPPGSRGPADGARDTPHLIGVGLVLMSEDELQPAARTAATAIKHSARGVLAPARSRTNRNGTDRRKRIGGLAYAVRDVAVKKGGT